MHVADVEQIENAVGVLSHEILLEVELHATALVGDVRERRLAMRPPRDDAPGDAHRLAFVVRALGMQRDGVGRGVRPIEAVRERRNAARDERVQLLASRALYKVQIVAHAAALPPAGLRRTACRAKSGTLR